MAGYADHEPTDATDPLRLVVDRDAEVPVGVQIAWALRARINEGRLQPGTRLPGLRELADATGVNVNTARVVYQRLERAGLVSSQQGTGTFVAASAQSSALGEVAARAAAEASDHGVDARDLASALYVRPETPRRRRSADLERRKSLRAQIAALELAASELEARHSVAVAARLERAGSPARAASLSRPTGPRMLGTAELEAARSGLVRRLAAIQAAIDESDEHSPPGGRRPRAVKVAKADEPATPEQRAAPSSKRRPRRRPPRPGLAGA